MKAARMMTVLATSLLLASCVPESDSGSQRGAETEASYAERLFEVTSDVLEQSAWTKEGSWGPCEKPRDHHVQWFFVAQSFSEQSAEPSALADRVLKAWQEYGIQATRSEDTILNQQIVSDPTYLSGTNTDGSLRQVSISQDAVFVQLLSACVPGDLDALRVVRPTPSVTPPSSP